MLAGFTGVGVSGFLDVWRSGLQRSGLLSDFVPVSLLLETSGSCRTDGLGFRVWGLGFRDKTQG